MKNLLELLCNIFFLNYIFYLFFCILFSPLIVAISVFLSIFKIIKSLSYENYLINKNTILDTKSKN